jgi:hypothetical protein
MPPAVFAASNSTSGQSLPRLTSQTQSLHSSPRTWPATQVPGAQIMISPSLRGPPRYSTSH